MPFLLPLHPLCILSSLLLISFANAQTLGFFFPDFNPNELINFSYAGDGTPQGGALQVTFDSGSQSTKKENSAGRVVYKQQLRLWDPAYNYTASFNTSFDLNIQPLGGGTNTSGGGVAFVMQTPDDSTVILQNSWGQWLGLFNSSTNGSAAENTQLVAVEFDTFKDSFDPDDNHVGIDSSSIVSDKTASLYPSFVNLSNTENNISVWVDYDGRGKRLDVYVANATKIKPVGSPLLSHYIDLSKHLPKDILVGFSASTGSTLETHCVLSWNFTTTEGFPVTGSGTHKVGLIVGLSVAAALALVLMAAVILVMRHRRTKGGLQKWPDFTYGPRKFTYKELSKATNHFSADCMLGEGAFGSVYKGILASDNSLVAVKRISPKSQQGEREFIAEVSIIGRLRHKNLVQLLGWCHDRKGELLLVYDYMPNGSLDQWLFGNHRDVNLDWDRRYNIIRGLAAALLYLHEEWEQRVVHRDLKASNVMLDAEYNARLGDFGLARLIENNADGAETKSIAGTPGYMAPECLHTGIVTPEADVYGFGAVAMEVCCGRRPYGKETGYLVNWLWNLYDEGRLLEAADPRLEGAYDEEEMGRLLMVGLACSNPEPQSRPSIREVQQSLTKGVALPRVPESGPATSMFEPASAAILSMQSTSDSSAVASSVSSSFSSRIVGR